ncbi:MAG TPA: hypothetical protein VJT72_17290 [Pseudonocardiaceae bacterium]|nr:hypothetical protein [Pseudonocardiaceae bacterium]
MPADLAAVRADDALLDMLGSSDCMPGDVDGELARVLAAWRLEVHADSARELVHTDTALAVISAARRPAGRRNPLFGRFAAAAAVMVIAFSTVGLLAKSAHPGDNLWPVAEVLFAEYARSVEAAAYVQTELDQAQKALQEGKPELAKQKLDSIEPQLSAIAPAEGKANLTARHDELERKLPAGMPAQDSLNTGSPDQRPGPRVVPSPSNTGSAEPSSPPDPSQSTGPEPSPPPTPEPSPPPTPDAESLRRMESNSPSSPGSDDPGVATEGGPGKVQRPQPPQPPQPRPPIPPQSPG